MDAATNAIIEPFKQYGVVGAVVIALGIISFLLWRALTESRAAHLAEVKACSAQTLDLALKKIDSDNKLANALEGLEKIIETALRSKA